MDNLFDICKLQIDGIPFALPREVKDLLAKGAILVDLREELETQIRAFGVERITYLPYSEFENKWEELPLDNPVIFADSVGLHGKEAAFFMKAKGYSQVASLAGGFAGWFRDGFPVKEGKYHPLNGPCPCMIRPHERK